MTRHNESVSPVRACLARLEGWGRHIRNVVDADHGSRDRERRNRQVLHDRTSHAFVGRASCGGLGSAADLDGSGGYRSCIEKGPIAEGLR